MTPEEIGTEIYLQIAYMLSVLPRIPLTKRGEATLEKAYRDCLATSGLERESTQISFRWEHVLIERSSKIIISGTKEVLERIAMEKALNGSIL